MNNDEFLNSANQISANSSNHYEELEGIYEFIITNDFTLVQQKELILRIFLFTDIISNDPVRKALILGKIINHFDKWEDAWIDTLSDPCRYVTYYGKKSLLKNLDQIYR